MIYNNGEKINNILKLETTVIDRDFVLSVDAAKGHPRHLKFAGSTPPPSI